MAGALKTLFGALQSSAFMSGVSLVFGEEEIADQSQALPMVVMVPTVGSYDQDKQPGYSQGQDPLIDMSWAVTQSVDFYLWGYSTTPGATAIDHADATEALRQKVLSALQDQRATFDSQGNTVKGLWFKVISERWQLMQNAFTRYGRALVISAVAEIPVPMAIPANATVTSESISYTVIRSAS